MTVQVPSVETPIRPDQPSTDLGQELNWRKLAQTIAAGGGIAAVLGGTTSIAGPFQVQIGDATVAIEACPVTIDGPTPEFKLAHKATFGYYSGLEQAIITQGYNAWLNEQLDYTNVPGWAAFEAQLLIDYPAIGYTAQSANLCCGNFQMRKARRQELQKARLIRAYSSPAQLYERMVEFWTDHLNTFALTPNLDRMKILEDREVIRANAFGKLKDLIYASAISPAMLIYLDGDSNTVGNPNENFAREFLELHTLGVDVCYDEATIQVLAKALTGWRVDKSSNNDPNCPTPPPCGTVSFDNNKHDNTAKTLVFLTCNQFSIPVNSGMNEMGLVVDMLTNPNLQDDFMNRNQLAEFTVRRIARKMATYFLNCNPPNRIIDDMWRAYQNAYTNGTNDITAMLKELLKKGNINCSGPIHKRPLHLAASAMRATGSTIIDPGDEDSPDTLIGGFLKSAGHIPYFWPAPNGYPLPCDKDYWGANQLIRENLGAAMFNISPPYQINGVDSTPASVAILTVASNQVVIDLIDTVMFGGFMDGFEKTRILQYMDSTIDIQARVEALGLAIGSPGFQWY